MGIRYLNSFLKKTCRKSIRTINLNELSNKRIVIDASIYMYQFEGDGLLLNNMKRFIELLQEYNIHPLFVFDGKPPVEKMPTVCYRREQRRVAAVECADLLVRMENDVTASNVDKLETEYIKLRRNAVEITQVKTESVKKLFDEHTVPYCTAPSEADTICASMVLSNEFWGCMSDDMDMLVYGCKNIIRDVNIDTHTARLYILPEILNDLNITYENFKRVCVISGTDYNTHHQTHIHNQSHIHTSIPYGAPSSKVFAWKNTDVPSNITFYTAIKLFERYQQTVKYPTMTFYGWLKHYLKFNMDYDSLERVYNMFSIPSSFHMPQISH